mmetsp:Transcript_7613/g.18785  ORF Transcript_7613/g.18785 Transcript_7613/m.18785 type:complete len:81 (-) Transcript_7613:163-405(-)
MLLPTSFEMFLTNPETIISRGGRFLIGPKRSTEILTLRRNRCILPIYQKERRRQSKLLRMLTRAYRLPAHQKSVVGSLSR